MKSGQYYMCLDAWEAKFPPQDRVVRVLRVVPEPGAIVLSVDLSHNRGFGIVRGEGREYALKRGSKIYGADEMRADTLLAFAGLDSHVKNCGRRVFWFVGNGNLLQNPHFVGFANEEPSQRILVHLATEPFAEREYFCLLIRKDGRVSIERLRFRYSMTLPSFDQARVFRCDSDKDITDEISYATYGQRLVHNYCAVEPLKLNIFEEFYDTRHLILNPYYPYYKNEVDFGMDQFRANPMLFRTAVEGNAIKLETRVMGEWLNKDDLVSALRAKDYTAVPYEPNRMGEYKFLTDKEIQIVMWPGIYPHNTIGIDSESNVVCVQFPGLSNRAGVTVKSMGQYLANEMKLKDAILLDNGGDVVMYCADEKAKHGFSAKRLSSQPERAQELRIRSLILFCTSQCAYEENPLP